MTKKLPLRYDLCCQGDSGGPLVLKRGDQWWLAGTVLGGNGCGSPDFPNVFQNVIAYQEWIEPIFSNRLPEARKYLGLTPYPIL